MEITLSNLRYTAPDNSVIDMDVAGVLEGATIPFTYRADDTAPLTEAITALLASGGYEIAAYVEPEPAPQTIVASPYQARVALLSANLLDAVETAINAKGGKIKIKWEYATEIRSDDDDLLELATEIGIADQIHALFQAAQQVT